MYRTFLGQNGFYDLQVAFMDMCLRGYASFVDMLCGCVTCAVTEDSELGLMLCCHHLKILFWGVGGRELKLQKFIFSQFCKSKMEVYP